MSPDVIAIRREGRAISASFRIQLSAMLLIGGWLLAALSPSLVLESAPLDAFADCAGWSFFVLGIAIRYWSILHIAGRKSRAIVDSGPYALCRNPLYVGTFLIIASEAAFLKSGWFMLSSVALVGFYVTAVVPSEERKLCSRIGTAFDAYCSRVSRWRPRFRRECLEPAVVHDRRAVLAEIRCLLWWTALPLLGEATCYLRVQPWWPHIVPGF